MSMSLSTESCNESGQPPNFKTIADFRKDNLEAIKRVCREFTVLCQKLKLFGGQLVAIDGSKFRAVNSRQRNFNPTKLAGGSLVRLGIEKEGSGPATGEQVNSLA
jgi:hypothetical protein